MANRTMSKLTALQVSRVSEPGLYSDGGGLYLQVTAPRGQDRTGHPPRSWIFKFTLNGKAREMGIGPLHTVSLAQARAKATECRALCKDGRDPIEARSLERAALFADARKLATFKECARQFIEGHKAAWRNAKHAAQWERTLETYAYPKIGSLPVQAIGTSDVLGVLEPIWTKKTETAKRLRGRIEAILDWANARGYREGENPARWRGHLDKLLPNPSKVQRVRHHAALPYEDMPEFMAALRAQEGVSARALEFAIFAAARTGEVIGARWSEIDTTNKVWIVPATRMKGGREHRVPLSARALAILEEMKLLRQDGGQAFVFPGGKAGQPLSNMAFLMLLRRMGRTDLTAHGFRSTFRDWAAERTAYQGEVAEMALAHAVGDKVEAAYRRGDLFEKRRRLMDDWARFCETDQPATAEVVAIRAATA